VINLSTLFRILRRSPPQVPLLALLLAAPAAFAGFPIAPGPSIELFSPQGQAKQVRQVAVRFTAPMVPLGDPRLSDPMQVQCPADGKGRWADGRNWVYDFDQDLPAGVACTFTLKPQLATLEGVPVVGERVFSFTTAGPAVLASLPREGSGIDEEQVFVLKLDAPASPRSIQEHARCVVQGVGEELAVQVVQGQARAEVLRQRRELGYAYYELLWKSGLETIERVRDRTFEQEESRIAVVRCQRRLPPSSRLTLRWGAGIRTESGIATTEDQPLAFRVRPAFTARAECMRANARAGCMPMMPLSLMFSAPVQRRLALGARLKLADGRQLAPAEAGQPDDGALEAVTFPGPFPEGRPVTVELPPDLVDDAGRTLENAARFPLRLRVDEYPPLARFSGAFGILEAAEGGILPVTLRNLEADVGGRQAAMPARLMRPDQDPAAIARWLMRVEKAGEARGERVEVPNGGKPEPAAPPPRSMDGDDDEATQDGPSSGWRWREDTGTRSVFEPSDATTPLSIEMPSGSRPAQVAGIALKRPGFYVVEIESRRLGRSLLGRDQVRYVATSALVTDLAVHFKWGRESSVVWVTRLSSGAPVAGSQVRIIDYCRGVGVWAGVTGADGLAAIPRPIGTPHGGRTCNPLSPDPLFVTAGKDDDLGFTQSGWDQGITPHQFGVPLGSEYASRIHHTVLDRALFRAGETVSMKHFVRRHRMEGFGQPDGFAGARTVWIEHEGSGQRYELQARFGADGIACSEWKIPEQAKLGDYVVSIEDRESGWRGGVPSGRFKVEQFRLPSMHASVSGPAAPLVRPRSADVDLHVSWLSGGGASGLAVRLRTLVESRAVDYPGYPDYQFGGHPVAEGTVTSAGGPRDLDFEQEPEVESTRAQVIPLTLDAGGSARVTVPDLPALDGPAQLVAELEYADANGETLTASARIQLLPSSLAVGIRREGWVASSEQARFRVVVVDQDGRPRARRPVEVAIYQSQAMSYRKRLIGGFYAYETSTETRRLPVSCRGETDDQGLLACEVAPGVSGQVTLRAETCDEDGRTSGATASLWVVDKDAWWFGGTAGDRMDVLPEQKSYEAGQTARLQVRMPFREATALVTVEREGVLSGFVTHLDGRQPVIEVPIAGNYAPDVFVSVLALRGRVPHVHAEIPKIEEGAEVTALVDLNKPAYRLGVARIQVGWTPHRLDVQVTPQRAVWPVRAQAPVKIHVGRADGGALPAGTEVAVAAVDEALLDLAPNPSWDLLGAMMGSRGLEVWTSTAQMQVVGKRHYGRKAVAAGGGGGRDGARARELLDSLLYWNPRVALDERGDAQVMVPLNDSLSAFRIVAIASGGAGLFGSGYGQIHTTQDLVLLSGLPPLVREADRYLATFTLRNTSDHALTVDLAAATIPVSAERLAPQRVEIGAGASRDLSWRVTAPVGVGSVRWELDVREVGGGAGDRLRVTQAVIPAYPVRTYQATIAQLDPAQVPLRMPAQRPAGAVPGRGGLEVTLRAHLGDGMDAVREFMSLYPYGCLEQRLSRAVALRDRDEWDRWAQRLPAYMDRDGLLRYFPSDWLPGDDTLTAYVLAIGHESGWTLNDADRQRLLQALKGFVQGRIVRGSALPTADLSIRKLAAIDALSRYGAAEPALLDSVAIEPALWPTSAVLDWLGILQRVEGIAHGAQRREEALQILRARVNFQGTLMGFSTERGDALWWLMISADSNANRMLLAVLDRPGWRQDIPRLVRGALGRQQAGHWNTTVANAWGALAMEKFSAAFESEAVAGTSTVRYAKDQRPVNWTSERNSNQIELPWQDGRAQLEVGHAGTGRPWVMVRATAALPQDKPRSTGFAIRRTVTPVEQRNPGRWSRGDVVRVRLELDAQSDMSWVVVDDPVPAGATILGSGLGGQSGLLARGERREGWAWPAYEERRFDGFRAYYRFVPKGAWTVEYTLRLNNPGTFLQPATRVEAMYAPEMFGELPNAAVTVEAAP
jgi:alpha-2-macroglobulin